MPRKAVFLVTITALSACATGEVPLLERPDQMEVVTPQRTSGDFAALEEENALTTVAAKAEALLDAPAIPSPTAPSRTPEQTVQPVASLEMSEIRPVPVQTLIEAKQEGGQNDEGQTARASAVDPATAPFVIADVPQVITGEAAPVPPVAEAAAAATATADDLNAAQLAEETAAPSLVMAHTEPVGEPEDVAPVVAAVDDTPPAEIPQVITGEPAPQPGIEAPQVIASADGAATPDSDEMKKLLAAERAISLLNAYRSENDVAPVRYNAALSQVAEAHVKDLAERGEVTALSSDGKGIGDRLKAVKVPPLAAGSLVSGGYTTFESALDSWKANSVQRERLLIEEATDVGFAVISDRLSTYGIYMEMIIAEMEASED